MDQSSPDKLTIETPEQIPLEFPLAGIGSRFLALALDTLIQAGIGILLALGVTFAFASVVSQSSEGGMWALAALVVMIFLIQFGYFALFEAVWNGQTPGKRVMHLRVIKDSGQPISAFEPVTRNLMRIVDSLPGIYAVGIASALLSSQNKRLGDYVAGTVVVHERPAEHQADISWQYAEAGTPSGYDAARLSPEEFQLIEAYLLRRSQLPPEVRAQTTRQIIARIGTKLEISPDDQRHPEPLLERLVSEYRSRARYR